ncbi:cyclase family protein [Pyrococcus abyssi]|nr:cyclase family protein [Pyrococcus abyssi]
MIVDLSVELSEETRVYPGDPRVEIIPWAREEFYMNLLKLGEHSGTHVDAPIHFIPNGKAINELPLEKFIGEGIVIDAREKIEIPQEVEGKIVLLLTGGKEITIEIAKELVDRNVKAVGIDGMSIGNEEVHKVLLSAEIPIYENLVNLEKLIGRRFLFVGLPLKIRKGSGSPVRAVAIIMDGAPAGI